MHSKSHTLDGRSDLTPFVFAELGTKPSLDEKRSRSLEDKNDPTPENSKCLLFYCVDNFNCLNKKNPLFFSFLFGGGCKLYEWFGRIYRGDVMCLLVWCQSWCGSVCVLSVASPVSKS